MRPLPNILREIVARRRERYAVGEAQDVLSEGVGTLARLDPASHRFLGALAARRGRAVIAEVKLGSPKLGSLVDRVDPERQAETYARAGAAALSVVVEPDFFCGSVDLLRRAKRAADLPTIAKDFVVHPRQLDEAAEAGADAILLIAALYRPDDLARWATLARQRNLAPLVEIHDASDLASLAGASWEVVGVNNRDLRTFEVDLDHSVEMRPRLPEGALSVAESGIARRADVERLRNAGFDAFLIGESLLLAPDPAAQLAELLG